MFKRHTLRELFDATIMVMHGCAALVKAAIYLASDKMYFYCGARKSLMKAGKIAERYGVENWEDDVNELMNDLL